MNARFISINPITILMILMLVILAGCSVQRHQPAVNEASSVPLSQSSLPVTDHSLASSVQSSEDHDSSLSISTSPVSVEGHSGIATPLSNYVHVSGCNSDRVRLGFSARFGRTRQITSDGDVEYLPPDSNSDGAVRIREDEVTVTASCQHGHHAEATIPIHITLPHGGLHPTLHISYPTEGMKTARVVKVEGEITGLPLAGLKAWIRDSHGVEWIQKPQVEIRDGKFRTFVYCGEDDGPFESYTIFMVAANGQKSAPVNVYRNR